MLQYITLCKVLFDSDHNNQYAKSLRGQTIWGKTDSDVCGRRCKKIINKFPWTKCSCVEKEK
ncbi:hypothetical protein CPAV1605_463 [seawater metagenome]|uniref:Uncharacterized protein n=1 Tax=seawater metagenome TaxID=1561972 RepID=A0A5E8CH42_9ZZZZ